MSTAIDKAYASIAEGQLHLRQRKGSDGAPALAMLHASPSSSRSLEPLMEAICADISLFAFDTPCNGQSCAPAMNKPSIADFANMIARGSIALELDTLVLYGTHTGAHIAIEWTIARPDQVKALVLDGVALLDDATRDEFRTYYAPPQTVQPNGAQFHWAWNFIRDQMIFFPHYKSDADHMRMGGSLDPALLHELTLDVLNNLQTYHMPYEAVFSHEVRRALTQIDVPTLVLSDCDNALDPSTAQIAALVPDARTASNCTTPAAKAQAIEKFMKELGIG